MRKTLHCILAGALAVGLGACEPTPDFSGVFELIAFEGHGLPTTSALGDGFITDGSLTFREDKSFNFVYTVKNSTSGEAETIRTVDLDGTFTVHGSHLSLTFGIEKYASDAVVDGRILTLSKEYQPYPNVHQITQYEYRRVE